MPAHHTIRLPRSVAAAFAIVASNAIAQSPPTLFHHVRVFDGTRAVPDQDVLIAGGVIARVGRAIVPPIGAEVIDGTGRTLIPGLIDAHAHVRPGSLESAIAFGVTTELDMFTDVAMAKQMRAEQAAGSALARVRNYLSEAMAKLGAANRVEAARTARQKGWL